MPNPWKKAKISGITRFISSLRSKRAGSLVVQTGFPTSLADLVVKNRSRLKKSSRKRHSLTPDLDSSSSRVSDIAVQSQSDSSPTSGIPSSPERDDDDGIDAEIQPPVPVVTVEKNTGLRVGLGLGLGFLLGKMVLLIVLAIGRKKLVAGITILAFSFCFIECLGRRVFGFLRPCSDARRRLNSVVGVFDLGREQVSPIREVGVLEAGLGSFGSEKNREESTREVGKVCTNQNVVRKSERVLPIRKVGILDSGLDSFGLEQRWEESTSLEQGREVMLERKNLVGVGKVCSNQNLRSSDNFKVKKLLRRSERISPFTDVEILKTGLDSFDSDRRREESAVLEQGKEVMFDRRNLVVGGEVSPNQIVVSSKKIKAKKLWKKFVPKKFRGHKDGKDKRQLDLDENGKGVSDCKVEEQEEVSEGEKDEDRDEDEVEVEVEDEDEDDEILSFGSSHVVSPFDKEDVCTIRENLSAMRIGSFRLLAFFIVVLFGLMGGRIMALVLTVACYLLLKLTETLWWKWKIHVT